MPHNKADKKENQQNKSSILEETTTINAKKASEYPPNLNEIAKNEYGQ
jgi:hypothetical protein